MAELKVPDFIIAPTIVLRDRRVRTVDGLIYGVVYWFTRLRNEKCTASNKAIAKILNCSETVVSHGLTRLNRAGYIQIRMDDDNHREEIIPLIAFSYVEDPSPNRLGGSPNRPGGVVQIDQDPSPNGLQNNNNKEEKDNNISSETKRASHGGGDHPTTARVSANFITEENTNKVFAKKDYDQVFSSWREHPNLPVLPSFSIRDKKALREAFLKGFTSEQIVSAIHTYADMLDSDEYFLSYRWTFAQFVWNQVERFIDTEGARKSYLKNNKVGVKIV